MIMMMMIIIIMIIINHVNVEKFLPLGNFYYSVNLGYVLDVYKLYETLFCIIWQIGYCKYSYPSVVG